MLAATPTLRAPTSVRTGDERPEFVRVTPGELLGAGADQPHRIKYKKLA